MSTKPVTAEMRAEIERSRRHARYCSNPRRPKRLSNRLRDGAKERFIARFLATSAANRFPFIEADMVDECAMEFDSRALLRDVLVDQVGRAFEVAGYKGEVYPQQVAADLLRSDCGALFVDLEHLPRHLLSTDLVLAHLESLGFDLPARVAAGVARRAFVLLITSSLRREP